MRICPPSALAEHEFSVSFINALAQYWRTTRSFRCIGAPKREHLLLLLDGCEITYTDKEGRVIRATDGDVVYTPMGSEYRAVLSNFRDAEAHTVGINFLLWEPGGEGVALSEEILVFRHAARSVPLLFRRALSARGTPLEKRILMLTLLDELCRPSQRVVPPIIEPAMRRLAEELAPVPTVGELARECHISEAYFRKLFRESIGESPAAYRKRLCLERACAYLTYGDISVGEIAALLGYASVSHFIKEFGQVYGTSPLQYRKAGAER